MNAFTQSTGSNAALAAAPVLRTLLACDLVDSTALVQRLGDRRAAELIRRHDRLARTLLPVHGGREIDKTDGFLAMFERPIQAVAFALAYQRALRGLDAEEKAGLAARVGIHVGDVMTWDNAPDDVAKGAKPTEVEGLVKPVTSRLMQLALPNQILLSGVAYDIAHRAQGELGESLKAVRWRTHGRYRFKGVPDPIPVFEVGEEGFAPLKPPPWSGKAHREVPFWRRPATMAIEAAALLALIAVPVWYLLKPAPAIAFANRDWVVVGDLKNLTTDAAFDDSVQAAFRIGLEQSRYVNVLSDLKARETVKLMQRDPERTKIDRAIGSEIAIRDGARALILPTVAEIGGRVRVTAEVVDPQTQTTVYSESADGVGEGSVLPSLDHVNTQLRLRLGEALATVSDESKPLDKVATKNLDALRAYALGQRAYGAGRMREAASLFGQAASIDPDFSLAHIALAQIHNNQGDNDSALREIVAAARADRLSVRDASYVAAWRATLEAPGASLEKWKTLTSIYADFFPAQGLYGYFSWQYANRYEEAMEPLRRAVMPQNAHRDVSEYVLGILNLGQERYREASLHFDRAANLGLEADEYRKFALAAERRFDLIDRPSGHGGKGPAPQPEGSSGDVALRVDRGLWTDVQPAGVSAGADGAGSVRRRASAAMFAGVRAVVAELDGATLKADVDAELAALSQGTVADQSETRLRALFLAYLAARSGRSDLAGHVAGTLDAAPLENGYPTIARLARCVGAQLDLSRNAPQAAVARLEGNLDDGALLLEHVVLMDAYAAQGRYDDARRQARWLAGRRGRAYTEYNADWAMRPFNVAQTDVALLADAEFSARLKDGAAARQALARFEKAWPQAARSGPLARRVEAVRESGSDGN